MTVAFNGTRNGNVPLGTGAAPRSAPEIDYHSLRLFNTYYFRVWRQLYAGAGLFYQRQADIEPKSEDDAGWDSSPFVTYSTEHAFDLSTQTAAGPGIVVLVDNRDNQNDAFRGWYFTSEYRFSFEHFLGGDSNWSNLFADLRRCRTIVGTGWRSGHSVISSRPARRVSLIADDRRRSAGTVRPRLRGGPLQR